MATASPDTSNGVPTPSPSGGAVSPPRQTVTPKSVAFELLFPEGSPFRARLPMRVQIYPHDTTDSIVTTVKNFYGLYSGPTVSRGVSFEDEHANTLIARYENFHNNMVVYVRVVEEPSQPAHGPPYHPGALPYHPPEAYPLQAPQRFAPDVSRPNSRTSRRRSASPNGTQDRRSASASTNPSSKHGRPRSSRNRGLASQSQGDGYDSVNGYSSGDNASTSTSGKAKEQIGNTDISVENIVEGGRRKRAKFESSELPLFAPPQMPAATSNPSISPARRSDHRASISFIPQGPNPFTHPRALQSPQSYTQGYTNHSYQTPVAEHRRSRSSINYGLNSLGFSMGAPGNGIIPTPDPTVNGSCVSEEDKDVAMQLMRLGADMSNISHGRTSASTLDDTFSGRADIASSTGATSDDESDGADDLPPARKQKLDAAGASRPVYQTADSIFEPTSDIKDEAGSDDDDDDYEDAPLMKAPPAKGKSGILINKAKAAAPKSALKTLAKAAKSARPANATKTKKHDPGSPVSKAPKVVNGGPVAAAPGAPPPEQDQLDLSTKPRCQRCRKSKKGCDRQRPCGRCRDAGLSADQCISEDEGNGRKGRYGRHMGVPIKKEELAAATATGAAVVQSPLLPAAPIAPSVSLAGSDKGKKRKR